MAHPDQASLPDVDEQLLDLEGGIVDAYARRLVERATPHVDRKTGRVRRMSLAEARLEVAAVVSDTP